MSSQVDRILLDGGSLVYFSACVAQSCVLALHLRSHADAAVHRASAVARHARFVVLLIALGWILEGSFWQTAHNLHRGLAGGHLAWLLLPLVAYLIPASWHKPHAVARRWIDSPWALLGLVVTGLLVRMVAVLQDFDATPVADSRYYDHMGVVASVGENLARHTGTMPLYSLWMSLQNALWGHAFWMQQVLLVLLQGLVVVCLHQAALLLTRSAACAFVAGYLGASYEILFKYITIPQIENFVHVLCAAYLVAFAAYYRKPTWTRLVLWAISTGLIVCTRSAAAAYVLAGGAFVLLWNPGLRRRLGSALLYASIVGAMLLAWGLENLAENGEFRLSAVQTNSAPGFSNGPEGRFGVLSPAEEKALEHSVLEQYPDAGERAAYLNQRALDFYREHPEKLVERAYHRTLAHFGLWLNVFFDEGPRVGEYRDTLWRWGKSSMLVIALGLAAALALALVKGRADVRFLLGAFLLNYLMLLPFSTADPRPRYPFDLCLILLAALWATRGGGGKEPECGLPGPGNSLALLGAVALGLLTLREPFPSPWAGYAGGRQVATDAAPPGTATEVAPKALGAEHVGSDVVVRTRISNYFVERGRRTIGELLHSDTRNYDTLSVKHFWAPGKQRILNLDLTSALVDPGLREGDPVLIEGRLTRAEPHPVYGAVWMTVSRIARVR